MRRTGQRGENARKVALLIVSCASALLLLEAGVRGLVPQVLPRDAPELWRPDATIGWRHNVNVRSKVNSGEREVDVCLDGVGDRVDCNAAARECRKQVLVIGDSFAEALAVPFSETVWGRIEQLTGACLRVAGVGGYGLGQYVQVARERLPDGYFAVVVISLYAGNDFTAAAEYIPAPKEVQRRPVHLLPEGVGLQELQNWFYPYNSWLESRSHAYVAIRFAIRRFQDPGEVGIYGVSRCLRPSRLTQNYLEETSRGLAVISRIAAESGARVLVSVLPTQSQVLDPDGRRLIHGLPRLRGDIDMNLVSERFLPLLRSIREIDAAVDLLPLFRQRADDSCWGKYDSHLSPTGHGLWMEGIRDPLLKLLSEEHRN